MNTGVRPTIPWLARMARIAITFARHRCSSARTKPASPVARWFHQPFWPAERGGDEDLVHRRVQPDPRVAVGERARVLGEVVRPVGVVEAAHPVGHPEVAQVGDGRDAQPVQLVERLVGEAPVVAARRHVRAVVGRPVAQVLDPELAHEAEVLLQRR
jgi:hypothetical protein